MPGDYIIYSWAFNSKFNISYKDRLAHGLNNVTPSHVALNVQALVVKKFALLVTVISLEVSTN